MCPRLPLSCASATVQKAARPGQHPNPKSLDAFRGAETRDGVVLEFAGLAVGVVAVVGVGVRDAALVGQGGLSAETVVGDGDVVVLRRVA